MDTSRPWPELDASLARMEASRATKRAEYDARTASRNAQHSLIAAEQDADVLRFAKDDTDLARRIAALKFARDGSADDVVVSEQGSPWPLRQPVDETPWRNASAGYTPLGQWRLEPPRNNGTAKSRKPLTARSIDSLSGLRRLVIDISLEAGDAGLTAHDLPQLIEQRATREVLERFRVLKDKVKNAADGLYVARESQVELGLVVERLGQLWRIRKVSELEVARRG